MNRLRRIVGGAIISVALVHSSHAAAQEGDCSLLRVLASHDPAALRALRLGYQPGVGISFWLGRNRAALAPATECEADADAESPKLECRWEFRSYAEAAAFYEPLLAQARRCLAVPFTSGDTQNEPSAWMVMRRSAGEISRARNEDEFDEDAVAVALELIESTHPGRVTYYVSLAIDR